MFLRVIIVAILLTATLSAQWKSQTSNTTESLRGVSAVNEEVVWASGTHGTYLRTTDGGEHWTAAQVPGGEALDFRDVEAFSDREAVLLAAGPGEQSRIYSTADAGAHWQLRFQNTDPKGFLDCMAFWDRNRGIVVGDPVDNKFVILRTKDGGATWQKVPEQNLPAAMEGEGAFAAGGTCIAVQGRNRAWFGTANAARVLRSTDGGEHWSSADTPLPKGKQSAGVFSIAFRDAHVGFAVGGDYQQPDADGPNIAWSQDGGATWKPVEGSGCNHGYLSALAFAPDGALDAVGTNSGVLAGNVRCTPVVNGGNNAVSVARRGKGRVAFSVGPLGSIKVLNAANAPTVAQPSKSH